MKLLALIAILATFVPLARAESATYVFSRIADSTGDGPGDDLEVLGGLRIAAGAGQQATLQVALLPPGQRITIDINAPSMPACTTCKITVGGAGTSGPGVLRLNRSTVLRLNARTIAPASDVGIEVESSGYLEIQGSLDESGVATAPTDVTTLGDATKSWSPGQHDGKVLRISSTSSLAFGRVYRITGTTATSVARADTSPASATVVNVTGIGASRALCLDHAGLIAQPREGVGRYLEVRAPGAGHLRVVHTVNDDPACAGADSLVVIGEPDPLSLATPGATVAIVDGVGADTGPACTSPVGGIGAAYLWAKPGSETVIRWAHICNLGRFGHQQDRAVLRQRERREPG